MIKTFSKLGTEGNFLNITNDICQALAAYIIISGESL